MSIWNDMAGRPGTTLTRSSAAVSVAPSLRATGISMAAATKKPAAPVPSPITSSRRCRPVTMRCSVAAPDHPIAEFVPDGVEIGDAAHRHSAQRHQACGRNDRRCRQDGAEAAQEMAAPFRSPNSQYFLLFSSLFFSTPPDKFFSDSAGPSTELRSG
jgi:hypothetical protein